MWFRLARMIGSRNARVLPDPGRKEGGGGCWVLVEEFLNKEF